MWNNDIQVKCANTVREQYERGEYDNLSLSKVKEKVLEASNDIKTEKQGLELDEYLAQIMPSIVAKQVERLYET